MSDGLYLFPLGGSRLGPARTYFNLAVVMLLGLLLGLGTEFARGDGSLRVHLSWGHASPQRGDFYFRFLTNDVAVANLVPVDLEPGEGCRGGVCLSRAGAGDVDGVSLDLVYPERTISSITNLQSIWSYHLEHSDPDTASRLRRDPAYRPDSRKLTVQMNAEGTKGFSVTVDQLQQLRSFWIPDLDVYLAVGDVPTSFAAHQQSLRAWNQRRVRDEVARAPEASYEQFKARWEDMGSPSYRNPAAPSPGHIVCLSWDSTLSKFGVDRFGGVRNDLGNPDHFHLSFEPEAPPGDATARSVARATDHALAEPRAAVSEPSQRLANGLPVITTDFERAGVRYTIEQFAFPLHGPPAKRRGDVPLVLLQQVKLTELTGHQRTVNFSLSCARDNVASPTVLSQGPFLVCQEPNRHQMLLAIEARGVRLTTNEVSGPRGQTNRLWFVASLGPRATQTIIIKLPSPPVGGPDGNRLLALDYGRARAATLGFWTELEKRGARFSVPERAVNDLFQANLWHALRLPRRHAEAGGAPVIDLPYSNFAYDQRGIPWPVNQSVYVDYMLYDLRGYHEFSEEELQAMFRANQEPNGHVRGFANWGVYTPGLLYAVAQHYLLSGDEAGFRRLLPATLKALDWCLAELEHSARRSGPGSGLILAPLNDLSHETRAWAFNQAYFYAGFRALGRALAQVGHPRSAECLDAARTLRQAVEYNFARAAVESPLVQLRDHSWSPYVPSDALSPRRLLERWYPTDVDTGALHLSRLQALDPASSLTAYLLDDHEDNLFLHQWGLANEPVYNQQGTVYLERDEVHAAIRTFYSMMAGAFSHSVFEPVEHRWAWGQFFGPPSTDGAWFELYRQMLVRERDDGSLLLLQATPRKWLADGQRIQVHRAPTFYGPLSLDVRSHSAAGNIAAVIDLPSLRAPRLLLVRFRHPDARTIRAVRVNGRAWYDFDARQEWVRIPDPQAGRYRLVVSY